MSERWHPSVALARRLGRELGADVMILARSETGQWAAASWGRTAARCASVGRALDVVFNAIDTLDRSKTLAMGLVDGGDDEDGEPDLLAHTPPSR